jgi:hypothetical protein
LINHGNSRYKPLRLCKDKKVKNKKAFYKETQEGDSLSFNEWAWEILYEYKNAEVSLAYPSWVKVMKSTGKIWRLRYHCELECIAINRKRKQQPQRNILSDLYYYSVIN